MILYSRKKSLVSAIIIQKKFCLLPGSNPRSSPLVHLSRVSSFVIPVASTQSDTDTFQGFEVSSILIRCHLDLAVERKRVCWMAEKV